MQDGHEGHRTFKTTSGYEYSQVPIELGEALLIFFGHRQVYPVEGLDGIRTLNPGLESVAWLRHDQKFFLRLVSSSF